jgi:hypothetical protein
MIRKPLYITDGHDEVLIEQARQLGIYESELARRALRESLSERSPTVSRRREAPETLRRRTRSLSEKHRLSSGDCFD